MSHLKVEQYLLEYKWIGPAPHEATSLVFLHEGLGCLGMWRNFPAHVAELTGCGALLYSRSGYGDSTPLERPRTARYLHEEALKVLPEVLRINAVEQPLLIGHSDGASIALIYAGCGRFDVRALILEAPHVFVEDATIKGIERTGEHYRGTDLSQKLARYHGDQTNAMFWSWYDTWLSPAFRDWNIEECLSDVTCPVLIIRGEDDEYGTSEQLKAVVSQVSGPVETLMLSDCGHTPHRDQPEQTLQRMTRFIKQLF